MFRWIRQILILYRRGLEELRWFLVQTRTATRWTITVLALISGLLGTILLIVYFGFPLSETHQVLITHLVRVVFAIYVLNFFIRWMYATQRWKFITGNWLETLLIGGLVVDFFFSLLTGLPLLEEVFLWLGIEHYLPIYLAILQVYLLILLFIEVSRFSQWLLTMRLSPPVLLSGSFLVLILLGTLLLLLPEMTHTGHISLVDALFTATSATCVTGLTVVDTATYFTRRGQIVIMLLIQLGGLGIVSFATFFAMFGRGGLTLRHGIRLQEQLGLERVSDLLRLLRNVLFYTFVFEVAGAVLLWFAWHPEVFPFSWEERLFYSIFHAISAFCNAGFTLFTSSLEAPVLRNHVFLVGIIALLFILGGLGFPAIRDLFSPAEIRERIRYPWKRIRTSTFIALTVSIALLFTGGILLTLLEWNQGLADLPWHEKFLHGFFQSATARTAGFSTISIASFSIPSLLLLMFLMFVGASSGSTGGGIKTSTFMVVLLTLRAIFQNRAAVHFRGKTIPVPLQYRAFAILFLSLALIMAGTFLLALFEPDVPLEQLLFEAVSAYCTVGLSTGITPHLSDASKIVLTILMFVGRVGPLTVAFALAREHSVPPVQYPVTRLMVG